MAAPGCFSRRLAASGGRRGGLFKMPSSLVELLRRDGYLVRDDDFVSDEPPRRISLTVPKLAEALRSDRELIACYIRERVVREAKSNERAAKMGLSSEELTGFALAGFLVRKMRIGPLKAFRHAAEAVADLFVYHAPARVKFCLLEGNRCWEIKILSGIGTLEIPEEIRRWMTVVDVTLLSDLMEEAIGRSPLRLPRVEDAVTVS